MMRKQIKTGMFIMLLGGVLTMASGCFYIRMTAPMHVLPDGRHFPKKPQFTVMPNQEMPASKLDFSSVYVWKRTWTHAEQMRANYFYFRFWPTGECIEKVSAEHLYRDDFEGFTRWGGGWSMGFYEVSGSNIVIEIYVPDSYNKLHGVISDNEVHITRIELKYAAARSIRSSTQDIHYIRHYVGEMSLQPDWSPTGMLRRVEFTPAQQQ